VIDAGVEAEVEVGVDDFAGNVALGAVADTAVVTALTFSREAALRETEGCAVLVEEVFLLEAEPGAGIVENGRAGIRGMRRAVGVHDFAKNDRAVFLGRVGIDADGLEHAVRAVALGLPGGAAVEAPFRDVIKSREAVEILHEGLAAEVRDGLIAVEPNVFQFILRHIGGLRCRFLYGQW